MSAAPTAGHRRASRASPASPPRRELHPGRVHERRASAARRSPTGCSAVRRWTDPGRRRSDRRSRNPARAQAVAATAAAGRRAAPREPKAGRARVPHRTPLARDVAGHGRRRRSSPGRGSPAAARISRPAASARLRPGSGCPAQRREPIDERPELVLPEQPDHLVAGRSRRNGRRPGRAPPAGRGGS